ncbi:hypothetical protein ACMU1B_001748 [Campylobacter jejuni]|uniref:hypothetical protein n=1 Tax=Campylobacter jejuni TaxID=197 RepID=UPI00073DD61F|nr:hypothetical protein [Campylobacter jejuni]ALW49305.1 hypothetical protein RC01_04715 [Campylobacter jejuni]ALW65279.1 hypothetical protein RC32_04650 [Campylobacter jejuni]ALW68512.1 hypothetical protein RC06_04700 [Campylobacter jejuni]EAK8099023.1 DUF3810 domain-containing protein [Campylobacter jejuni]EAL0578677.1 DUF3810 domain-containing protein [Campylobacter jejuni]
MFQESKMIEDLKREYNEKLKKIRQKEKERKEKIYKKLSIAILKDFEVNQDFINEFNSLINKLNCNNTKSIMETINSLYNFNKTTDTIEDAKNKN